MRAAHRTFPLVLARPLLPSVGLPPSSPARSGSARPAGAAVARPLLPTVGLPPSLFLPLVRRLWVVGCAWAAYGRNYPFGWFVRGLASGAPSSRAPPLPRCRGLPPPGSPCFLSRSFPSFCGLRPRRLGRRARRCYAPSISGTNVRALFINPTQPCLSAPLLFGEIGNDKLSLVVDLLIGCAGKMREKTLGRGSLGVSGGSGYALRFTLRLPALFPRPRAPCALKVAGESGFRLKAHHFLSAGAQNWRIKFPIFADG